MSIIGGKGEHREGNQVTIAVIQVRDDVGRVRGGEKWINYILNVELSKFGRCHPIDAR